MVRAPLRDTALPVGATTVAAVAFRAGGRLRMTLIAKATFAFARDLAMTPVAPQPIFEADVHHGNHPTRSVRFASDLAPHLGRAEVLFTGHAHAPGGAPVQELAVRLGLFHEGGAVLDKALVARQSAAFTTMPIVYERAFGGAGSQDNPIGVGADEDGQEPTIVDPRDAKRTIGLGPIGRAWPARRRLLGATPRQALEGAIAEIPDGFDWAYFQSAPADQRVERLRGDEWLVMDALHPEHARLRMRLPGARGRARVYGLSASETAEGHPLELTADTLRIDGDERCCTVTWRASFPVPDEQSLAKIRALVGVELPGQPIAWPAPPSLSTAAPPAVAPEPVGDILANAETTMALPGSTMAFPPPGSMPVAMAPAQSMPVAPPPFSPAPAPSMPVALPAFGPAAAPSMPVAPEPAPAATLAFVPGVRAPEVPAAATPFRAGSAPLAVSEASAPAPREDTGTVMTRLDAAALAALRKPLPFEGEGTSPADFPLPDASPPPAGSPATAPLPDALPGAAAFRAQAPENVAPAQASAAQNKPDQTAQSAPGKGFSWAADSPAGSARPQARRAPAPPPEVPGASPALKKGLYGRFGGKG